MQCPARPQILASRASYGERPCGSERKHQSESLVNYSTLCAGHRHSLGLVPLLLGDYYTARPRRGHSGKTTTHQPSLPARDDPSMQQCPRPGLTITVQLSLIDAGDTTDAH
jgi:hypothetical protein